MQIDSQSEIIWDLELFLPVVALTFEKIRPYVLKLYTNMIYQSRTFGIEFGQNGLKRSIFLKIYAKLSNLCKLRVIELKFRTRMH